MKISNSLNWILYEFSPNVDILKPDGPVWFPSPRILIPVHRLQANYSPETRHLWQFQRLATGQIHSLKTTGPDTELRLWFTRRYQFVSRYPEAQPRYSVAPIVYHPYPISFNFRASCRQSALMETCSSRNTEESKNCSIS